jgi:hypothetical protein
MVRQDGNNRRRRKKFSGPTRNPHLVGYTAGGMAEDAEREKAPTGGRFINNGQKRMRDTNEEYTQAFPKRAGNDSDRRTNGPREPVAVAFRKEIPQQQVEAFHISKRNGIGDGGTGKLASVQGGDGEHCPQGGGEVEDGPAGGKRNDFNTGDKSTEDMHTRRHQRSKETGTHSSSEGSARDCMGNSCQGGRCKSTAHRGRESCGPNDEGQILYREDGIVPTLYSNDNPTIKGDVNLYRTKIEGGGGRLAVPKGGRGAAEDCAAEGSPKTGTTFHKEGGPPTPSTIGPLRRSPPPLQPAQKPPNVEEIFGFRLALGGVRRESEGGGRAIPDGGRGSERGTGERCNNGGGDLRLGNEKKKGRGVPKFWKKNFVDPPSWQEVQEAFPLAESIQKVNLPLNIKKVSPGSIEKLKKLPSYSKECLEFLEERLRILTDENLYINAEELNGKRGTRKGQFPRPALSRKEMALMEGYKIEKAETKVRWGTFAFKVAEPAKERCRAIFDCCINDIFPEAEKYSLKSKYEIRKGLCKIPGTDWVFIQFDFKSFYDQFVLGVAIRKFFGVIDHDGMEHWVRLLPMGFRLAVGAAQAAMWQFLNFDCGNVFVATCIDNVCFAGERASVHLAAKTFLRRVEAAGFTLNDIDFELLKTEEQMNKKLWSLEEEETDFLGERYNFPAETRRMTEKTLTKLTLVWDGVKADMNDGAPKQTTNRQLFCLVGILIFGTEVLQIDTHPLYNVFKKIRSLSSFLSFNEKKWDDATHLTLTRSEVNTLKEWIHKVKENKPVWIKKGKKAQSLEAYKPDRAIVMDASVWGWGAILYECGKENKILDWKQERWEDNSYSSSVKAETEAMVRAARCWPGAMGGRGKLAIITDHVNMVHASQATFVKCFFYNRGLQALQQEAAKRGADIRLFFVPGELNNADGISRGAAELSDTKFPTGVTTGAGSGVITALPCPWQH